MKKNVVTLSRQAISKHDAELAIKTVLSWIGEDCSREGLLETPSRIIKSYKELFAGYHLTPDEVLAKTFDDIEGFSGDVVLKNIEFASMCEHHMLPIVGKAHVAYMPAGRIVGLSKIARLVEMFARRLQVQERMTVQVAEALQQVLQPQGVAVVIEAEHYCMTMRGVSKAHSTMITSQFTGVVARDQEIKKRVLGLLGF